MVLNKYFKDVYVFIIRVAINIKENSNNKLFGFDSYILI